MATSMGRTQLLRARRSDFLGSGPTPDSLTASTAKISSASAGDRTAVLHAVAACTAQGDSSLFVSAVTWARTMPVLVGQDDAGAGSSANSRCT